jgi:hypothetical protein
MNLILTSCLIKDLNDSNVIYILATITLRQDDFEFVHTAIREITPETLDTLTLTTCIYPQIQ